MNRLSNVKWQRSSLLARCLAPLAFLGLLSVGCLYEENDRCGPNQVLWDNDRLCVCAEGFTYTPTGCVDKSSVAPDPTGSGKPCTSDADCTGQAASYCELVVSHSCLVPNCTTGPDNCQTGFECCPFSTTPGFDTLPNLCLAAGLCTL
jgi:hypothetical protein